MQTLDLQRSSLHQGCTTKIVNLVHQVHLFKLVLQSAELRCDENFIAGNAGCPDRSTDNSLILIVLRSVQGAVTYAQCIEGPYTSWWHMFGWNVFGLPLMGPAVATWRFFDTLNKIERKLNG